jgi:hypothetical protein
LKIELADGKLSGIAGGRTFALRAVDVAAFEPAEFPGSQRIVFVGEGDKVTALEIRTGTNVQKFTKVTGGAQ